MENMELLQELKNKGIIKSDSAYTLMNKEERQRILSGHPYDIFSGSDGRVKTYLQDFTKKSGRKLIAKSSLEKLEDAIIEDYLTKKEEALKVIANCTKQTNESKKVTLKQIYPEWIDYKFTQTDAASYIQRIHCDWNKYYRDTEIVNKPIEELTYLYLNKWAYNLIRKNNLTKEQYYNITVIIRQSLDYCAEPEIGIIENNPFSRVKFKSKMFRKRKKPDSSTQVFLNNEREMIISRAYEKFLERPMYTTPLAIILNFTLGLRIGELCVLNKEDIDGRYINIQRSSIKDYEVICGSDVELIPKENRVVDYVKSSAGERKLYLTDLAMEILEILEKTNKKYGYYDEGYLFVSSLNKKTSPSTIDNCLSKICKEVGINVPKGNHKIRKTFISSLFDANININTIREIAGHESEQTSLRNYCFDRNEKSETESKLETLSMNIRVS